MITKKSNQKYGKPKQPPELAEQSGWGVVENVFHRAINGDFVNLQTGEVRHPSEFKDTPPLKITLTSENQQ